MQIKVVAFKTNNLIGDTKKNEEGRTQDDDRARSLRPLGSAIWKSRLCTNVCFVSPTGSLRCEVYVRLSLHSERIASPPLPSDNPLAVTVIAIPA
ncbi:MAG: hypothetical protein ACXVI7_11765 [Halobacteriota archaeon]